MKGLHSLLWWNRGTSQVLSLLCLAFALLGSAGAAATNGGLLTVDIAGQGGGSVDSIEPYLGDIRCPGDCSQSYFDDSDMIILVAVPDEGFVFTGWGGSCIGTDDCIVTMVGDRDVTAFFSFDNEVPDTILSITLGGDGTGTVTSDDQSINCPGTCSNSYSAEDEVELTAIAANGSIFTGWQGDCAGIGSCTVSMSEHQNVTAIFDQELPPDNTLTVALSGEGTGSVSSDDGDIDCPGNCSQAYPPDASVTLTATSAEGSTFTGWDGGGCTGTGSCIVSMSENRNVSALFEQVQNAELAITLDGSGAGSVRSDVGDIDCPGVCDQSYTLGEVVTLTATAAEGSTFTRWEGACTGTDSCIVDMSENRAVTALFDEMATDDATLNVVADGSGTGSVDSDDGKIDCSDRCSQSYADGETVTLTATAADGSVFTGWHGEECSGTGTCEVTMSIDRSVTAQFQIDGDEDRDLVPDSMDQCMNTPPGETVNAVGCSVSQPQVDDGDQDGVPDTVDQCPNTPQGQAVDEVGCSDTQTPLDDDGDGVPDTLDQCPNTPFGQAVDALGCSDGQSPEDDDNDDVPNGADQCANTLENEIVDAAGCSVTQTDGDGDGVTDSNDSCPATPGYIPAVDSTGCPVILEIGNQLGGLQGLGLNEQVLGTRLDEICPMLAKLDGIQTITAGNRALLQACSRLKNTDTTENEAAFALREISVTEIASQKDYATDIATTQYSHVGNRIGQIKAGGGGGLSMRGLNLGVDGQAVPDHVVESVVEGLLGMGASGDSVSSFGKLGLFVQGDLDFGDRDETELESGYDFDSWSLTLGGDYRFTDQLFAGLSASVGDVEVDYAGDGGSTDISNWTLSLYSGWSPTENIFIDGLVSYGESDIESARNINYVDAGGSWNSTHNGDTDGDQLFIGINTGYVLSRDSWRFGPTASLTYLEGSIDGFVETSEGVGSEAWNFAVEAQDYESLRLSLGVQADYIFTTSFGVIIPGIRVSYVMEQEDDADQIDMRLVNNPFSEEELSSSQIVVRTDGQDSGFLDTSLNLSGQFVMGFSGFVSYRFYSSYDDYSREGFAIGLRWDKPF